MENVFETIYTRLLKLGIDPNRSIPDYAKSESGGYMDLHLNRLVAQRERAIRISLAHYFTQNGDSIPDPDMEIDIFPDTKMAEALSYQDSTGYQVVYPATGSCYSRRKKELNAFLVNWLKNCIDQGHSFEQRND